VLATVVCTDSFAPMQQHAGNSKLDFEDARWATVELLTHKVGISVRNSGVPA